MMSNIKETTAPVYPHFGLSGAPSSFIEVIIDVNKLNFWHKCQYSQDAVE
jgi:hypothetical protein